MELEFAFSKIIEKTIQENAKSTANCSAFSIANLYAILYVISLFVLQKRTR